MATHSSTFLIWQLSQGLAMYELGKHALTAGQAVKLLTDAKVRAIMLHRDARSSAVCPRAKIYYTPYYY